MAGADGRRDAAQMAMNDSALNPEETARIRTLLAPRAKKERMWPVLAAALLAAISALAFATAMIMAPPVVSEHVAPGVR
jgi:hypothetical protein